MYSKIIFFFMYFSQTLPSSGVGRRKKFPMIKHNYESSTTPGMFFAGGATHSLDFRKSAGGFIHGYRYTGRTFRAVGDIHLFSI